jgi:DAK2 domain fusion protein YloV
MFDVARACLENCISDINAINVFPVPDGDTGVNMHLTMCSALKEIERVVEKNVSAVAKALAHGALMGARGNSGVILSQFFRGLAKGLDGKESITANDYAMALKEASEMAYQGLPEPVEGTMITVIRDMATAAEVSAASNPTDLMAVVEAAVDEAKKSVARTPLLLPVLSEAGVVDAGGQGVYVIQEGILRYLRGETSTVELIKTEIITPNLPASVKTAQQVVEREEPYGYCTNFLIVGQKLNPDKIQKRLDGAGQSLVVAGDQSGVRVHIHTYDPGNILRYATSVGTLHNIEIQNMDDQHEGFIEKQQEKQQMVDIAVVTIVAGDGMSDIFKSLGVTAVVPGGQTMNPSVSEVLQVVESVPSNRVIILPNNKNIILTALKIQELTLKEIAVVPTRTIPQGVAAMLEFDDSRALEENVKSMEKTLATVTTIEITRAVRSARMNGLSIKKGQAIGIIDDNDLVTVGDDISNVLFDTFGKLDTESSEVVTLYYGADVEAEQAEQLSQEFGKRYPDKEITTVAGMQPYSSYIISLE